MLSATRAMKATDFRFYVHGQECKLQGKYKIQTPFNAVRGSSYKVTRSERVRQFSPKLCGSVSNLSKGVHVRRQPARQREKEDRGSRRVHNGGGGGGDGWGWRESWGRVQRPLVVSHVTSSWRCLSMPHHTPPTSARYHDNSVGYFWWRSREALREKQTKKQKNKNWM